MEHRLTSRSGSGPGSPERKGDRQWGTNRGRRPDKSADKTEEKPRTELMTHRGAARPFRCRFRLLRRDGERRVAHAPGPGCPGPGNGGSRPLRCKELRSIPRREIKPECGPHLSPRKVRCAGRLKVNSTLRNPLVPAQVVTKRLDSERPNDLDMDGG